MTIEKTNAFSGPYVGTGVVNQSFPVTFQSASASEVAVLVNNLVISPASYTFTRNADGTGTVKGTFSGNVFIVSLPRFQQETAFQHFGPYFPDDLNAPLDRAAARDIYLKGVSDRALTVALGSTGYVVHPNMKALLESGDLATIRGADGPISGASAGLGALFTSASGMTIATGITAVVTSGHTWAGIGGARYIKFDLGSLAANQAQVAANPRTMFQAVETLTGGALFFTLDPVQPLTIEMFGGRGDLVLNQAGDIYGAIIGTPTDNLPAANAYANFAANVTLNGLVQNSAFLYFSNAKYYFSGKFEPRSTVHWRGQAAGADNRTGTILKWPSDSHFIVINTLETNDGNVGPGGGFGPSATASTFENLYLLGSGGVDRTKHGVWARSKTKMRNCTIDWTAGCSLAAIGSNGFAGDLRGNCNHSEFESITSRRSNGPAAFYTRGIDANGISFINCQVKDAAGAGFMELSGLGNTYINPRVDGCGSARRGHVHYMDKVWTLTSSSVTGVAPDLTQNDITWLYTGEANGTPPNATWPAYDPAVTYEGSLAIIAEGNSNATTIIGGYSESIIGALHNSIAVAYGGQYGYTDGSNHMFATAPGSAFGRSLFNRAGVGAIRYWSGTKADTFGTVSTVRIGRSVGNSHYILSWQDTINGNAYNLQNLGTDFSLVHGDISSANPEIFRINGSRTTRTAGRATAVPYMFTAMRLGITNAELPNDANTISVDAGNAPPTTGAWRIGDIRINNGSASPGVALWQCTAAGTPGTWAALNRN